MKRNKVIRFNVNANEDKQIVEGMVQLGMSKVGEYVRYKLFNKYYECPYHKNISKGDKSDHKNISKGDKNDHKVYKRVTF